MKKAFTIYNVRTKEFVDTILSDNLGDAWNAMKNYDHKLFNLLPEDLYFENIKYWHSPIEVLKNIQALIENGHITFNDNTVADAIKIRVLESIKIYG